MTDLQTIPCGGLSPDLVEVTLVMMSVARTIEEQKAEREPANDRTEKEPQDNG